MNLWVDFACIIATQVAFFFLVAYTTGLSVAITAKKILVATLFGIVFGVVFDFIIGKYAGVFSYHLGWSLPFLVLNGALSYGLMFATILLLKSEQLKEFYLWTVLLGMVYE